MSDIRYACQTSYLNRIGDDCFRLILQYTQIKTLITTSFISTRANQASNHTATKYLPIITLDLRQTDLCQSYSQARISSVIPKLQLRTLNLSGNDLGLEGITILASHLKLCPELQTLHLEYNWLGDEEMKVLIPQLFVCQQLQTLNLRDNRIDAEGMEVLYRHLTLINICPQLRTLNI